MVADGYFEIKLEEETSLRARKILGVLLLPSQLVLGYDVFPKGYEYPDDRELLAPSLDKTAISQKMKANPDF